MAKGKKRVTKQKEVKESPLTKFNIDNIIPEKYQVAALFGIILFIFLIYLSPMFFGGKTIESGDIITSHSLTSYLEKDRDSYSLWYPYIFTGMPAYALAVDFKWFNLIYVGIRAVREAFTLFFSVEYTMWTFYLIILAFTSFLLVRYLTKNNLLGMLGGVATSFSTGIILFLFIGHVTKLVTLAFVPLILLMLLRFRHEIRLRDFAILIIALQLAFQGWHVQIIFYTFFAIGIYYLYFLVYHLVKKESVVRLFKSAGVFAAAAVIALAIQADNLTQIYAYNDYSTRGTESIVDKEAGKDPQGEGSGFYKYATDWSFSPGEVLTFVVPSYYGFGASKYNGPLTQGREVEVNTYFGQMPFVDVAMYMGAAIFFLGLFAMYADRKNPIVQYLIVLVIISLLISFGRTFPVVFDLMFNFFPFFNKFRVPSMILVLVQISFPVLAALGIKKIADAKKENDINIENIVKYAAYAFTGLFVISLLANSAIGSWFVQRVNDYAASISQNQRLAQQFQALAEYMSNMFVNDLLVAFGVTALTFWMLFAYMKSQVSLHFALLLITVFVLADLLRIDSRAASYNENQNMDDIFQQPDYVTAIKNTGDDQPYRIMNIKRDGSLGSLNRNSNFNGYFLLQDMYGYSAIKPRSFQDYMDVVGPVNPTLWRMLNVKYVVTESPMQMAGFSLLKQTKDGLVYNYDNTLPRAYFVDSVTTEKPIEFLRKVGESTIDPKKVALVNEQLNIDAPDSTASVTITSYEDERIELDVTASGSNLLFLGDTYYPNGWHAYIDGEETTIHKVNHGYRGVVVPQGKHNVVFEYLPQSFVISKYVALVLSSMTLLVLVLTLVGTRKRHIE